MQDDDRTLKRRLGIDRRVEDKHGGRSAPGGAGPGMYRTSMSVFLAQWFTSYEVARAALDEGDGVLLPFRDQFFVTEIGAVAELGLDPGDPDWERIGRDWVRPADRAAWERLRERREIEEALAR